MQMDGEGEGEERSSESRAYVLGSFKKGARAAKRLGAQRYSVVCSSIAINSIDDAEKESRK